MESIVLARFVGSALARYPNNETIDEVATLGKPLLPAPESLGGVEHSPR